MGNFSFDKIDYTILYQKWWTYQHIPFIKEYAFCMKVKHYIFYSHIFVQNWIWKYTYIINKYSINEYITTIFSIWKKNSISKFNSNMSSFFKNFKKEDNLGLVEQYIIRDYLQRGFSPVVYGSFTSYNWHILMY